jgi:hypothetical protein
VNHGVHVPVSASELCEFVHQFGRAVLNLTAIPIDARQPEAALQVQVSFLLTALSGAPTIGDNAFLMHAPEEGYHAGNLRLF